MEYRFAENKNYEDFSCGRVIYHQSGFSNYPVRLASEIFQRCVEMLGNPEKINIYDPCCGGGYLLTVLGLLHGEQITTIYGSDIAVKAVETTTKNLQLLTTDGLLKRIKELETMYDCYQKDSHLEAMASAKNLLEFTKTTVNYDVFERDVLHYQNEANFQADIIITDVPYGDLVHWSDKDGNPIDKMLDNLLINLTDNGIIAISSDKQQKITNPSYQRVKKIQIGKRKVEFLRKIL